MRRPSLPFGGWTVVSCCGPGTGAPHRAAPSWSSHALDRPAVAAAARNADVVLHALNPPYNGLGKARAAARLCRDRCAEAAGATLLFPGNVYNYGVGMPAVLDEATRCSRPRARADCA